LQQQKDPRFQHLKNKLFKIPIINKEIPLIFDSSCSTEKGTGVLKVTPAHAITDNEIGNKHNLDIVEIIDKNGKLFNVPSEYKGLNIQEARKKIEKELKKTNNLIEIQEYKGVSLIAEKSKEPIETIMTNQWFLNTSEMAKTTLKESEKIKFFPENLRNTFKYWMENIKPWCISRQIWWGHEIPIWYENDGSIICAHNETEALKQ